MIHSISAQLACLSFSLAVVAGVRAGNSFFTVLTRALVAMIVVLVVARIVAALGAVVIREHLVSRKLGIDRAHVAAIAAMNADAESNPAEGGR
ncbi:hypothetical protein RAS1_07200 [Phycisphaerae bacterium RAS1]|nr:hypothetical protein RAS1_07200 [Phycisphaerae bacterium RAS1]